MPIDPMIANPATIQLQDPMERYGKYLTNALMMDKMSDAENTRAGNALMGQAIEAGFDPTTNQVSPDKARAWLVGNGGGRYVPDVDKSFLELDKTREEAAQHKATAGKADAEALLKAVELYNRDLDKIDRKDATIGSKQYKNWAMRKALDPFIGPHLLKMYGGDPAKLAAALEEEGNLIDNKYKDGTIGDYLLGIQGGLGSLAKQNYTLIEEKGRQVLAANPENTLSPFSQGSQAEYGEKPHSAGVNVNVGGGDKYAEEMAKLKAADDFAKGKAAEVAPLKISEFERGENLVDRAFTGYWAEGKTSGASALGVSPDAVQATQELKQILSGDMLKNIGSLRTHYDVKLGSVTKPEFEQLQNTMPKITDSPATIKAWFKRAKEIERKVMADYERLVVKGAKNSVTAPVHQAGMVPPPPVLPPSAPVGAHSNEAGFKKNVQLLKSGKVSATEFDAHYGPGAAAQATGGTQPGNRPLP